MLTVNLLYWGEGETRNNETWMGFDRLELGLNSGGGMPGNVTNVQDYLKMAKVFVMTSRMESMGVCPVGSNEHRSSRGFM